MQNPDPVQRDVPPLPAPARESGADEVDSEEEDDGEQNQEGDQEAPPVAEVPLPVVAPAPHSTGQAAATLDRYHYDRTSIVLVVHFRPVTDGQPRQVWLSAQNEVGNEQDFPLYRLFTEADLGGPWPTAVTQLLEDLKEDLPRRKRHYEEKQAAKPSTSATSPPVARQPVVHSSHKSAKTAAKQPPPPPPVPTSSNPIPKQELAMPRLFDGIE